LQPPEHPSGSPLEPSSGNFFRHDGPAGTVVFLVALPLCLGIALASGAPLFSGIIAGVIGGVVISALSGSQISVSGPAAGLTVIVAAAIASLGSFQTFLAAVVLAGVFQIVMGVLRTGRIADYVPNCVIKGMLAGIGLVIILKQIPHAFGRDTDYEGDFAFLSQGGNNTITDILASIASFSPGAVLVAGLSLALLLFWDGIVAKRSKMLRLIPGPILVVLLGIGINQFLAVSAPSLYIREPEHLVSLPVPSSLSEFLAQFTHPALSAFANPLVWKVAFTLAIVASLESLLALEASDRLDPYRRISPPNRELMAQGVGNILSGLVGGLPITSVVIRTSANVFAGGRTWMSSFIHGVLLFSATLLIPTLLNLTPLACLAVILIVVGYKLTSLGLYRSMYARGPGQFIPFIVTVLAIIFTDLLVGVTVGLIAGLFFVIRANHHSALTVVNLDNYYLLRFNKDASFVNKNELRSKLRAIPAGSHVIIDGSRALYVDHDIFEVVEDFQKLAPYKQISVEFKRFEPSSELVNA